MKRIILLCLLLLLLSAACLLFPNPALAAADESAVITEDMSADEIAAAEGIQMQEAQSRVLAMGRKAVIILLVAVLVLVIVYRVVRVTRQDKS